MIKMKIWGVGRMLCKLREIYASLCLEKLEKGPQSGLQSDLDLQDEQGLTEEEKIQGFLAKDPAG